MYKMALIAAAGGAIGSALRYVVGLYAIVAFGARYPYGTLIVNVVGCLVMGALVGLAESRLQLSPEWRIFLATGILGGFTTFSAFALDFAMLAEQRQETAAALYVGGSVLGGLLALFLGLWAVRSLA
jgi:CrcB protein